MPSSRNFFSDPQVKQIESVIQFAEQNSSGEIRVHIENHCKGGDPVACAQFFFHKLGMDKTDLHNGVMFYLAVQDHKFAVIGDSGIDKHVPSGFWEVVRDKMQEQFTQHKFTEGLCEGIAMTGMELKKYFPLSSSDKNELSNEVTFGAK
jgi:uncharacterized membrane protein